MADSLVLQRLTEPCNRAASHADRRVTPCPTSPHPHPAQNKPPAVSLPAYLPAHSLRSAALLRARPIPTRSLPARSDSLLSSLVDPFGPNELCFRPPDISPHPLSGRAAFQPPVRMDLR